MDFFTESKTDFTMNPNLDSTNGISGYEFVVNGSACGRHEAV